MTREEWVDQFARKIEAIEASLKLDRALWDEYEARLDAHGASNLAAHTLIHDLQRQLSERPTWDDLRAVLAAMRNKSMSDDQQYARRMTNDGIARLNIRKQESAARAIAASRSVATPDVDVWKRDVTRKMFTAQPTTNIFVDDLRAACDAFNADPYSRTAAYAMHKAAVQVLDLFMYGPKQQPVAKAPDEPPATEPAPSSAAELRDAVRRFNDAMGMQSLHAPHGLWIEVQAAASRAVEEIAELRANVTARKSRSDGWQARADAAEKECERLRDEIEDHAMQAVTDDDNRRKWRARAEAAEKECERLRAQVASHCLTCREQIAKREAAEKSLASNTAEADRLLNMMAAAHERDATALQQAEAERDEARREANELRIRAARGGT